MKNIFTDNKNFYPTPPHIAREMISGLDWSNIENILEPSAGAGDLVDEVLNYFSLNKYSSNHRKITIDCIELDENLKSLLRGKYSGEEFRKAHQERNTSGCSVNVIYDDFLRFNSLKKYDLIVMNPPFDNGEKHLLQALKLQERYGGGVICLLNAETIRNLYSIQRKELKDKLDGYDADYKFIKDGFTAAERKTGVETVIIKVLIPEKEHVSTIWERIDKAEKLKEAQEEEDYSLIPCDYIEAYVHQFNVECRAGIELMDEYKAFQKVVLNNVGEEYPKSILSMEISHKNFSINSYIESVRLKYWRALFQNPEFTGKLTSTLRNEYTENIEHMKDYDFSLHNILQIQSDIYANILKGVENEIITLFDYLSEEHSWIDSSSKNIHYYNGWKTNKAHKINKKVILPLNGWSFYRWNGKQTYSLDIGWRCGEKLDDIMKVFDYLATPETAAIQCRTHQIVDLAKQRGLWQKIEFKYFYATFYKKGTCHIEFKVDDLLEKFNLYGSQKKGWLPP